MLLLLDRKKAGRLRLYKILKYTLWHIILLQNCLVRCDNGAFTAVVGDFGLAEKIPDYRLVHPLSYNRNYTDLWHTFNPEIQAEVWHLSGKTIFRMPFQTSITTQLLTKEMHKMFVLLVYSDGVEKQPLAVVGSPYWMAPEMLRGELYNEKVSCLWKLTNHRPILLMCLCNFIYVIFIP